MNDLNESPITAEGAEASKATDASIVKCHARLRRKPPSASAVKFFSNMILVCVLIFAWIYQRRHMADYDPQMYLSDRAQIAAFRAYEPAGAGAEQTPFQVGEKIYATNCASCHQANGQGLAGNFPPLAGSEWVTTEDPTLPIKISLSGIQGPITVNGQSYNGAMPVMTAGLDDAQVAGLMTFIRQSWGNEASEVAPEKVAEVRAEFGSRTTPWSAQELRDAHLK